MVITPESVCVVLYELWKKFSVLFGSDSLKVSVLFDLNSYKSVYYCLVITLWKCQYCFIWILIKVFTIICSNSLKVSLLFDMNSGKVFTIICSNSLKVSLLFDMNSRKIVYYYLVVTFWKCQLAHFISAFWGKEGSYHLDILIMYLTDNIFLLRVLISRKVWQKTKHLSRWLDFFCTHMLCLAPSVILHLIFLILTEYTSFCSHSNSFIVTMYVASEDSLCLI